MSMRISLKRRSQKPSAEKLPPPKELDDSLRSIEVPTFEVPSLRYIEVHGDDRYVAVPRDVVEGVVRLCGEIEGQRSKAALPIRELYSCLFGSGVSLAIAWLAYEPGPGHEWRRAVFGCACVCTLLFGLVLMHLGRKIGALGSRGLSDRVGEIKKTMQRFL